MRSIYTAFYLILSSFATGLLGDSPKPEEAVEVFVEKIEKVEVYDASYFGGLLRPLKSVSVVSEIDGTILRSHVVPGQKVRSGQMLFELKPKGVGLGFRKHRVTSPITGRVATIIKDTGSFVRAGDKFAVVMDASKKQVEVQVSTADVAKLKLNQVLDVDYKLLLEGKIQLKAKVISISPVADPRFGTYQVRMDLLCNAAEKSVPCPDSLRVGEYVKVILKLNLRQSVLVDVKSLTNKDSQAVIVKDGLAKAVDVKTGKSYGLKIEILSGLEPGMNLITSYSKYPKDGRKVLIKDLEKEKEAIYSESPGSSSNKEKQKS